MSEHSTQFVQSHTEIQPEETEETKYGVVGTEITNERERFFAKQVVKNGSTSYYIQTYQNAPLDKLGAYASRADMDYKLKKVSKNTFDFFMVYLKTNNSIYFTRAQRSFNNND